VTLQKDELDFVDDDVIILHPVIEFHGPSMALNFHVDWFDRFLKTITNATETGK